MAMHVPALAAENTPSEEQTADYDQSSPVGSEFRQIYWNKVKFNNFEDGESPLTALSNILTNGKVDDRGGSGFELGLEGWAGFASEITAFGYAVNDEITWNDSFDKGADDAITAADKGGQYAKYYSVTVDISNLSGEYTVGVAARLADGRAVLLNSSADPELNTFISFIGPESSGSGELNIETGDDVDKVPGPVIFFDDEGEYTPFITGEHDIPSIGYDDDLGCLLVYMENSGDPYFTFAFPTIINSGDIDEISADDYKVIALGIRHDGKSAAKGQFFYGTKEHPGYSEEQSFHLTYERTADYQSVYVDLREAELWSGDLDNCRLDPFSSCFDPCNYEVYYIAFFKTMAGAVEFGENWANAKNSGTEMGPVATATPDPNAGTPTEAPATEEPTAAPATAEPTEVPATAEPTAVPAATEAGNAEATKDPAESSSSGLSKGALAGIIAGAALAAAVVAALIIVLKKKKK